MVQFCWKSTKEAREKVVTVEATALKRTGCLVFKCRKGCFLSLILYADHKGT